MGRAASRLGLDRRSAGPVICSVLFAIALGGCAYVVRDVSIFYMKVNADLQGREIQIDLDKSFIAAHKNKVDITAVMTVDRSMKRPNPALLDGDLHFAGRAPAIGLPTVAEIANAASAPSAVDLVHRLEGKDRSVKVQGVWRIWAEHAGRAKERQGEAEGPDSSENPGHVFEIHPVMKIGGLALAETFRPVRGYKPGEARHTFGIYQSVGCKITAGPRTVSLVTRKGVDNDVEFIMELADGPQEVVPGGRFATASVLDLDGRLIVERLRLVFAKGTPPERAVRGLKRGGRLHVYGLPRISLAEIWRRVQISRRDPAVLSGPLPYEIIIQGVYGNE